MRGGWVGWIEGVDGRWMEGRPHSGSPHVCQTMFGMLSTPPHPKVHDLSHKPRRIELIPFDYDGLNRMDLGLVIL